MTTCDESIVVPGSSSAAASSAARASALVPLPKVAVTVRAATLADVPFIDRLQKMHAKQVGWMPTKQLEGKIAAGQVLVAEEVQSEECRVQNEEGAGTQPESFRTLHSALCTSPSPIGYLIAQDRYFKRDDLGIIYQMNVEPGRQRGLIGATLLKAQFERSAWGCKLYCCWCAQDIAANKFWEAMGFVPLAYRAGSRGKGRVHIFWQRRIRSGDTTTPYWFPSQTSAGSIREDRLVLPIRPGMHWSDAHAVVLPGEELPVVSGQLSVQEERKQPRARAKASVAPVEAKRIDTRIEMGALRFGAPPAPLVEAKPAEKQKPKRKPAVKNDPKLVAAARELRDRWLEHVNREGLALASGKYDVSRAIGAEAAVTGRGELLPAGPHRKLPDVADAARAA